MVLDVAMGVVYGVGLWGMARPTIAQQDSKRREMSEKQMAFAVWSATPDGLRDPGTQDELCEILGITRQTAWRWGRDPRMVEAVRFLVLQNAGSPNRVGQILDMLFEESLAQRSPKTAEVWLKATGFMTQFQRSSSLLDFVEAEQTEFTEFSLEELQMLRAQVAAGKDENIAVARATAMLKGLSPGAAVGDVGGGGDGAAPSIK